MNVTVILCTFNRHPSLAKALECLARQQVEASIAWCVLVVDNNSSDQTREVAGGFCQRYPERFRYVFEPQPGKSYALNTGIRVAKSDILAFVDDDVTIEPTWLQNLTSAFENQECAGAGGRILPAWVCPKPVWLSLEGPYARLGATLALFDLGPDAGPLKETPFGTNMAFRRAMFEKYGGFRTDLGPQPGSMIRNEDTEFGHRLLSRESLTYVPSAVVYHPVPGHRLQKHYFLTWWFDKGRADIRTEGIPEGVSLCRGVPWYLCRRVVSWALRWMLAFEPQRRFDCKIKVWANAGAAVECYRQATAAKRQRGHCSVQG